MFPPTAPLLCFHKRQMCTSFNALLKVQAKHANCSVFAALTNTECRLESQPQRRRESSGFIDLFTVYYAAACHTDQT